MFYLPIPIKDCSGEPINEKKRKSRGYEYTILKYDKQITETRTEPYTLVTNTRKTKVFAYMAPRETIDFNNLKTEDYQEGDIVEVKESVEGTMITFFWNDEINEWNICTRNGVGGDYSFIHPINKDDSNPKTFREMVVYAFRISLMVDGLAKPENVRDLSDVMSLDSLSKTHCYTCILEHNSNHIVYERAPFCSFLKLVAVYETGSMPPLIAEDSDVHYIDCLRELTNPDYPEITKIYLQDSNEEGDEEIWKIGYNVFSHPRTLSEYIRTFDDIVNIKKDVFERYVDCMILNNDKIHSGDLVAQVDWKFYPPSWILTNNRTGNRCEIKNPFYELAKELRNMQPNMRYQYLYLRLHHIIDDYLLAFPRYKTDFAYLEKEFEQFVTEVHNAYVKFYIKKDRSQHIPKQHFVHAARIHHNMYLTQQFPRRKVTRGTVYSYFELFSATKLFYFLTRTEKHSDIDIDVDVDVDVDADDDVDVDVDADVDVEEEDIDTEVSEV